MRRLAVVGLVVGCSAPARPPPIAGRAPATPEAPDAPAPRVAWAEHGFEVTGLPAVSRDGELVVLAIHDDDGGRGNPNLRIVTRDRHDLPGQMIRVLDVDDAEAMISETGPVPALDAQIAATNRWLSTLDARVGLTPLPALEVDGADRYAQHAASAGTLVLDWQHDRLTITRAGSVVLDQPTPASWLVDDHPMCAGCTEICRNPAKLGAAAVDLERRIAVVTVSYNGTDTCWEPPDQHHVVAW